MRDDQKPKPAPEEPIGSSGLSAQQAAVTDLDSWLQTPIGNYVRAWEQKHLDALTADIFGFNAVQIGLPQIEALNANRMPYRWLTDTAMPLVSQDGRAIPQVVAHDFSELPFATQSLDLVVLPHVLEFSAAPHQVLREVERVLIPEGQVIICGFNPISLWGMRQGVGRLTGAHFLPQDGEFINLPRLKDWLQLLNMEVNRGHFGCYAPPCTTDKWLQRFDFMEKAGDRWWPYLGAVYIVQAIKRVKGMRLIGPAWQKQKVKVPKGVPATNRIHREHRE
ncbi:SAM-dependent methyltransferase [Herbaspirillum sp. Sphag1AN]|uniref:class I SAM-dependent methyltransferase n=1 Tax=unclassified Herbaspirillum TaxID=2624150 RepID=UPI00161D8671|nr:MULTISPECIES: class I SAM-dependent methyltransferase [unclassified Herbaspirillum]MBB3211575.1 SAM-dependent methyltransferase [Herbaspirillum sp. Sphag1AN]MBB3245158.1 SAM-dependent methyltransferase [Herbaspirillum sp. Sphag64]